MTLARAVILLTLLLRGRSLKYKICFLDLWKVYSGAYASIIKFYLLIFFFFSSRLFLSGECLCMCVHVCLCERRKKKTTTKKKAPPARTHVYAAEKRLYLCESYMWASARASVCIGKSIKIRVDEKEKIKEKLEGRGRGPTEEEKTTNYLKRRGRPKDEWQRGVSVNCIQEER